MFFGPIKNQDGRPDLCLAETFSTSPLKPLHGIQLNLTRKQDLNVLYQVRVFGLIEKTRWPPWPLIRWGIFDFSSETAELNSTKLNRKQDLNVLYQVCVFRADRKNKMGALASDWLRHFRLLLWNRWTEFNETWQEARSQRPLPCLYYSGWSVNKNDRPGLKKGDTLYSGAQYMALWASCKHFQLKHFIQNQIEINHSEFLRESCISIRIIYCWLAIRLYLTFMIVSSVPYFWICIYIDFYMYHLILFVIQNYFLHLSFY